MKIYLSQIIVKLQKDGTMNSKFAQLNKNIELIISDIKNNK